MFFRENKLSSSINPIKNKLIFLTCFYPHHILVITANWPLLKMRNGSELSRMLASSVYQVCLVERLYIFFLVTLKYKLVLSQISVHAHSGLEMWIREKTIFWVRKINNWNCSKVFICRFLSLTHFQNRNGNDTFKHSWVILKKEKKSDLGSLELFDILT